MNVIGALRVREGSIHLLDINAAMRHLRVTSLAGRSRVLTMTVVAGKAAYAFMNSNRGAIISGANLRPPMVCHSECSCVRLPRSMALVAKCLALIRTDLDGSRSVEERR